LKPVSLVSTCKSDLCYVEAFVKEGFVHQRYYHHYKRSLQQLHLTDNISTNKTHKYHASNIPVFTSSHWLKLLMPLELLWVLTLSPPTPGTAGLDIQQRQTLV
jgi:hypothetical protein